MTSESDTANPHESPFPVEVDTESVTFRVLGSGELETVIETTDGEDIVQVSRMPDVVYEQLVERGDIRYE